MTVQAFAEIGGCIELNFAYSIYQVKSSKDFLNQENYCKINSNDNHGITKTMNLIKKLYFGKISNF